MGMTRQLAERIANASQLRPSAANLQMVRFGFVDTIGVILAGIPEPVTDAALAFARARGTGDGPCRALLGPVRLSSRDAAMVNAAAGHALDYDDVGLMGHPSVVLVPALLAEGERLGASGSELMRAYIVGFETWGELIRHDQDLYHVKGWHPTAVFGVMGAAAAVAALRRLDVDTCQRALGIAASLAGGLIANFGSMTKPLHAGWAAAGGIDACDWAQLGVTAAPDAIEHHAGLLAALSPKGRFSLPQISPDWPAELRLSAQGLTVKKYPMCFATHRVLDGLLDLVGAHHLRPEDVLAVEATVGPAQASMLRNHRPITALEGKFSLEFAVAASLVSGKVGLAELTDAYVAQAKVQAQFDKVKIAIVDTVCPGEPTLALSDRVVVTTRDGRRLDSGEIFETRGGGSTPITADDLRIKFLDCAARGGRGEADAIALFDHWMNLDRVTDIRAG